MMTSLIALPVAALALPLGASITIAGTIWVLSRLNPVQTIWFPSIVAVPVETRTSVPRAPGARDMTTVPLKLSGILVAFPMVTTAAAPLASMVSQTGGWFSCPGFRGSPLPASTRTLPNVVPPDPGGAGAGVGDCAAAALTIMPDITKQVKRSMPGRTACRTAGRSHPATRIPIPPRHHCRSYDGEAHVTLAPPPGLLVCAVPVVRQWLS